MTTILEAIHIDSGKAVGARADGPDEVATALDESIVRARLTQEQINGLYQAATMSLRLAAERGACMGQSHGWIVRCRLINQ